MIITGVEICKKLQEMRQAAGYSQEQMADYLGVTQSAVSKYERGRVPDAATYEMWKWFCNNPPQRFEIYYDRGNKQHA